jgi:hypothetical protein
MTANFIICPAAFLCSPCQYRGALVLERKSMVYVPITSTVIKATLLAEDLAIYSEARGQPVYRAGFNSGVELGGCLAATACG